MTLVLSPWEASWESEILTNRGKPDFNSARAEHDLDGDLDDFQISREAHAYLVSLLSDVPLSH